MPPHQQDPAQLDALRGAALAYKPAQALARRQRDDGLWSATLLAPAPSKALDAKDVGTITHYRHLLELGWPPTERPFRIADRFLFRLLSRDADPTLLVEFQRAAKSDPGLGVWARAIGRDAAAAALARAGHVDDPRLRGAAHRIASDISLFLRTAPHDKLFRKAHGKTVLDPDVSPPTIFAIETLAFLPAVQRERAGFLEHLGHFLGTPAPRRAFFVLAGKRLLPPIFTILGDPTHADAQGRVDDVPLATYWLELLARLGLVRQIPTAAKTLARLFSECDAQGIWTPKNLRTRPKTESEILAHYYPLEGAGQSPAQRQTDITFRLALIARLLNLPIEVV